MNETTDTTVSSIAGAPVAERDESLGEITRKTFWEANEPHFLGGGFILLALLVWEAVPYFVTFSRGMELFFTTPIEVFATLFDLMASGRLWPALQFSASAFGIGLGLSIVVALPLGVVLGRSTILNAMFDPFITAINATPRLVFLPIVLIWMGIGMWSVVTIVFIGAVFPLLINTYAGVRNADRVLINDHSAPASGRSTSWWWCRTRCRSSSPDFASPSAGPSSASWSPNSSAVPPRAWA